MSLLADNKKGKSKKWKFKDEDDPDKVLNKVNEELLKKFTSKKLFFVFPSNFCFPHAVTPVTKGNRHAIITWIR